MHCRRYDANGNGQLDRQEFAAMIDQECDLSDRTVSELFDIVDSDG